METSRKNHDARTEEIRERARIMKERHLLPEDDDIHYLLSRIDELVAAWPTAEYPLPSERE